MPLTVSRAALLAKLREMEPTKGKTTLIAIDGCGGAGKSFLAAWLAARTTAQIVHIDDFGRPGLIYDDWDWQRLKAQVVDPALAGRKTRYQRYDWDADALGEWIDLEAGGRLIAEGVTVTRTQLGDPWDLKVWVECPADMRLARGLDRDGIYSRDDWVERWMPEEERFMRDQRPHERADYVVLGYDPA